MSGIKKRIEEFSKYKGISVRQMEALSLLKRGNLSNISESGTIGVDKASKILDTFPDLSPDWFLTGRGSMIRSQYKIEHPEAPTVNEDNQIMLYGKHLTDKKCEIQQIPLYATEISAGLTTLYSDQTQQIPIGNITIPNSPKCDGAIPVRGDSMYPILKAGDIVCYKEISLENALWGEIHNIYIDADGDEMFVTKYLQKSEKGEEYVTLVSYNPHHQPQDVLKKHIKSIAIVKMSIRYNTNI